MTTATTTSYRACASIIVVLVIVVAIAMPQPPRVAYAFSTTITAVAMYRPRGRYRADRECMRRTTTMNGKTVDDDDNGGNGRDGIRLNKVFKATHSRRAADALIKSGRVSINDVIVYGSSDDVGTRVMPYRDVVKLDGRVVTGWEGMNAMMDPSSMEDDIMNAVADIDDDESLGERMRHKRNLLRSTTSAFEYVKYHKPVGVTCTTDTRVPDNIVHSIRSRGYVPRHRVYPVGRLDRETSGLILLTSDGRVINSVLRGERKLPKVYDVMVDGNLSEDDLRSLRDGIVIKTVAQRKGRSVDENTLIAKTRPCLVNRISGNSCRMTLVEGRNRQIRKMMEALGHMVVRLHRVEFMGIRLSYDGGDGRGPSSLSRPGDWSYLNEDEMSLIEDALWSSSEKM